MTLSICLYDFYEDRVVSSVGIYYLQASFRYYDTRSFDRSFIIFIAL